MMLAECLLCKLEDLCLDPYRPHENADVTAHICNLSAVEGGDEHIPGVHCPTSPAKSMASRFSKKPCPVSKT